MIKQKFSKEQIHQVNLDMFKKDSWFKSRTKVKDSKCQNCGRLYKDLDCDISFLSVHGELNKHICHECGEMYLSLGAIDIKKLRNISAETKNELISSIRELGNYKESGYYAKKLDDLKIEELKDIFKEYSALKLESDRIDAIVISEEDKIIEDYLIKDYEVIQDFNYLKCEDQIKSYFEDVGTEFFECGQGYYQDLVNKIIKIGKTFYDVTIEAEINSAKQDRGDRLYWVENISNVKWKEIEKPKPKEKITFSYKFTINEDRKRLLDSWLKENNYIIDSYDISE